MTASQQVEAPSFASLAEAVKFLAANLDDDNIGAIAAGCVAAVYDLPETEGISAECRVWAIRALRRRHLSFSRRWRYWWRRFPRKAEELRLRLGSIHIDFIRAGPSWKLEDISMSR